MQVTAPYLPRFRAGDVVEIEGELESPPVLENFDYAEYLAQRGIHTVMAFPEIAVVGYDDPGLVRGAVLDLRRTAFACAGGVAAGAAGVAGAGRAAGRAVGADRRSCGTT